MLVKSNSNLEGGSDQPVQTINPTTIMLEIAKAVYLEDVMLGKGDS